MKKTLALVLTAALAFSFAACSNKAPAESNQTQKEAVTLKVGASPTPHAVILEAAKPLLLEKGINLEIVEFDDYVIPNTALADGDLDANYFQHQPYLTYFNESNKTDLVSAGFVHFEPLGIYGGKSASLDEIKDGDKIAVPNDATNGARALLLLQTAGIIKLAEGADFAATVLDIAENPYNVEIVEVEAVQTPNVLPDVNFAFINGNYAIGAGLAEKVLLGESADSAAAGEYGNIVAVRRGDETRAEIVTLVETLQSDEIKTFINDTFGISVQPVS